MKERNSQLRRFIVAGTLLLAHHQSAFASITGSANANADGTYTYSYTVDNSSGRFDLAAWSLEFNFPTPDWDQFDAPTGDVQVPLGWGAQPGIPVTGLSAQDFFTLSPNDDVKVNSTLNGFSFTSRFQPGTVLFSEFAEATGAANSGSVVGPAATTQTVPDSGTGFGLIALGTIATLRALNWQRHSRKP
jgi:hypothetical protein